MHSFRIDFSKFICICRLIISLVKWTKYVRDFPWFQNLIYARLPCGKLYNNALHQITVWVGRIGHLMGCCHIVYAGLMCQTSSLYSKHLKLSHSCVVLYRVFISWEDIYYSSPSVNFGSIFFFNAFISRRFILEDTTFQLFFRLTERLVEFFWPFYFCIRFSGMLFTSLLKTFHVLECITYTTYTYHTHFM